MTRLAFLTLALMSTTALAHAQSAAPNPTPSHGPIQTDAYGQRFDNSGAPVDANGNRYIGGDSWTRSPGDPVRPNSSRVQYDQRRDDQRRADDMRSGDNNRRADDGRVYDERRTDSDMRREVRPDGRRVDDGRAYDPRASGDVRRTEDMRRSDDMRRGDMRDDFRRGEIAAQPPSTGPQGTFRDEYGFRYDSQGNRIDGRGRIISPQTR